MAAITPTTQIVALKGDEITILMRAVPKTSNQVSVHIQRNGATATQFTLNEMRDVIAKLNMLLTSFLIRGGTGGTALTLKQQPLAGQVQTDTYDTNRDNPDQP